MEVRGQRSGLRNLVIRQDDFNLKSDLQMFQQLYDGSLRCVLVDSDAVTHSPVKHLELNKLDERLNFNHQK